MRDCSVSSSISVSVIARSNSVADSGYLRVLDDAGNGDHLVPAHHERPGLSVGAGDLGVDEHVLDLLRPAGESVAGPPSSHFQPGAVGADPPLAPLDGSGEVDRAALEPEAVVLADH